MRSEASPKFQGWSQGAFRYAPLELLFQFLDLGPVDHRKTLSVERNGNEIHQPSFNGVPIANHGPANIGILIRDRSRRGLGFSLCGIRLEQPFGDSSRTGHP
ncbi:MAG: hypothetical protein ACK53L_17630, partial [Pirellulaceae bacterium]